MDGRVGDEEGGGDGETKVKRQCADHADLISFSSPLSDALTFVSSELPLIIISIR